MPGWFIPVLNLIVRVAGYTATALTISSWIQAAIGTSSNGTTIFQRLNGIADSLLAIDNGITAMIATLATMTTVDATTKSDILNAVNDTQRADTPVILPSPPSGYGGPSSSVVANDVWAYVLGQGEDAGSALDDLYGSRASLFSNTFATLPGFPFMVAYSLNGWQNYAESNIHPPAQLDSSTILPTDASILAWANRAHHGTVGWTNTGFRGTTVPMQLDDNRSDVKWIITMTPAEFEAFQAVPATLNIPPVWPGYANITFSTAHALATGLSINTPMDGVIIDITGVPTRANFYQYDNVKSYRNLGGITFYDDNGDFEQVQLIGLETQIITPRTMKRAAGVKLRTEGGVSGTVSPWTINP